MKLNWTTKLISLAVLALGMVAVSNAQGAGPSGSGLKPNPTTKVRKEAPIQVALGKLTLTKDQKGKIKQLLKTRRDNIKAFRDQNIGNKAAIKENAEAQQKVLLDGIKGVLSPTDWDKFQDAYKEAMAANRKGGKKNKAAAGTGTAAGTSTTGTSGTSSSSGTGTSSTSSSTGH